MKKALWFVAWFAAFVGAFLALEVRAAGAAVGDPSQHEVSATCGSLVFDPEPGSVAHVRVQMQDVDGGAVSDQTYTETTGPDRRVIIPWDAQIGGRHVQWRASLPDVFGADVFTPWADLDCRPDATLNVAVACGGITTSWSDLRSLDPISVAVTYPNVTDSFDVTPDASSGRFDRSHPLLDDAHVTIHASQGDLTFDAEADVTGCAAPPEVPPTVPPAPPTPPAATPKPPCSSMDCAVTGAGEDITAILGGLALAAGLALLVGAYLYERRAVR